jgi:AraC-like DNA-binding protein
MNGLSDALAGLLASAERVIGLTVVVHDHSGILIGVPLQGRHFHRGSFCQAGRDATPSYDRRCQAHCRYGIPVEAARVGAPFVHCCWKGGAEACVPVMREGVHHLTLFAGVLRAGAVPPPGLGASAVRAWRTLPPADPDRLADVGQVLATLGLGILALMDAQRRHGAGTRTAAIEAYIEGDLHRRPTVAGLAGHFGLSPSRTAHLVTAQFGMSFGVLLQERRLARARHLLATTDATAAAIAERCGFISQHWFNRLFARQVGSSPGRWRRLNRPSA